MDGSDSASAELARLNQGRRFLQKAVKGLSHLGRNNVIIDRCVDYLKQLHSLVDRWGKALSVRGPWTRANLSAANSSSPRTLDSGLPGVVLDPFSSALAMEKSVYPNTDLGMRVPRLDGAFPMFDDLELGGYFATDFQRWI